MRENALMPGKEEGEGKLTRFANKEGSIGIPELFQIFQN
jgi:hypothetical protein